MLGGCDAEGMVVADWSNARADNAATYVLAQGIICMICLWLGRVCFLGCVCNKNRSCRASRDGSEGYRVINSRFVCAYTS